MLKKEASCLFLNHILKLKRFGVIRNLSENIDSNKHLNNFYSRLLDW